MHKIAEKYKKTKATTVISSCSKYIIELMKYNHVNILSDR